MSAATPPAAPALASPAGPAEPAAGSRRRFAALTLGAIGVVYGDIGTSPLYTVREIFAPATGVPLDGAHLVGAVSAIVWSLMIVVSLKYVLLVLRADNHGEGGALALTALAARSVRHRPRLHAALMAAGLFGATLFYGDSVITPAISVLGAMEGLLVVTPRLAPWVVPASLLIVCALFAVQRLGTGHVGRWFGPVIVLWFVTLAVSGGLQIARQPAILAALDPREALHFLVGRGPAVFAAVGAIVLAITGAEALYADIGHFGRRPIQLAWTVIVYPSLALNYLGQGALLMAEPSAIENPFFRLFPPAAVPAALLLATLAAIIASQAVISGAYSMTRQAIQLGHLPRMAVHFTSAREAGQIYMPAVNVALFVGVAAAVAGFGSSSALAGAYGIAVTMTMLITTVLAAVVARGDWRVPMPLVLGGAGLFVVVDGLLVAGCGAKLLDGGWFPLALGLLLFTLMTTWHRGREALAASVRRDGVELQAFLDGLDPRTVRRADRTAVYPVSDPTMVPQALLHNLKHYQVLHERNVVLHVVFHAVPWVPMHGRVRVEALGHGFWRVRLHFGFMNVPDVPRALALAAQQGLEVPPFATSWFLSRESVVVPHGGGLAGLRLRLFAAMSRHAGGVVDFFRLPGNAVVELGTRVTI